MAFTYTPSDTPSDLTRVRFHIEDTTSPGLLSDEVISMVIAENDGDWKQAVIVCISAIMAKLSRESGVTLDWLRLDRGDALDYYAALKREKAAELGVSTGRKIAAAAVYTSRKDNPS